MSEIRKIRCADILDSPNSPELLAEYGLECEMPDYLPQRSMYEDMEARGAFDCFGAYLSGRLIGFISIVNVIMPHNGKKMALVESLFVSPAWRDSGAGNDLLAAGKSLSRDSGCVAILYSARAGSRLETILSRSPGCKKTHTGFTEWL